MALACDALHCGTNWILQVKAALFCHKPGASKGIASYLLRGQHSLQLGSVLSPTFAVTAALALPISRKRSGRFLRR